MSESKPQQIASIAQRVQEGLSALIEEDAWRRVNRFATLRPAISELEKLIRLYTLACKRRFHGAARRIDERALADAERLARECQYLVSELGPATQGRGRPALPSPCQVAAEMAQIEEEFGRWSYSSADACLRVHTEPIELEGVYLGPFEITIDLRALPYLHQRCAVTVSALDPHPASGSDSVTHPHVSDERVCMGDANTAMYAALRSGRLADALLLIRGVLTNYNPDSPYVDLDHWSYGSCEDCGGGLSEDSRMWCEDCDREFCDSCMGVCRCCDTYACLRCLKHCDFCDEDACDPCLRQCSECSGACCVRCLDQDLCPNCLEEKENEDEQALEEQEEDQEDQPAALVQANGSAQASVVQGPDTRSPRHDQAQQPQRVAG